MRSNPGAHIYIYIYIYIYKLIYIYIYHAYVQSSLCVHALVYSIFAQGFQLKPTPRAASVAACMAPRSKQTITLEKLKEVGKATLKEPNSDVYLNEDIVVVVKNHVLFLETVAFYTKRLNPCSVALMGKDCFQMSNRESQMFGDAMAQAYSHCLIAGAKATTGEKLTKEVHGVYLASIGSTACKSEVNQEAAVAIKREHPFQPESPPAKKFLQKCLSSPSQITSLYAGSSAVKVMHCMVYTHIYIYMYIYIYIQTNTMHMNYTCIYIYIYIYI